MLCGVAEGLSTGAGAHVDKPSAAPQSISNQVDGARDLGKGALHCCRDFSILRINDARDFQRRFQVQVGGSTIGLLGGQAAQVLRRRFSSWLQTLFSYLSFFWFLSFFSRADASSAAPIA